MEEERVGGGGSEEGEERGEEEVEGREKSSEGEEGEGEEEWLVLVWVFFFDRVRGEAMGEERGEVVREKESSFRFPAFRAREEGEVGTREEEGEIGLEVDLVARGVRGEGVETKGEGERGVLGKMWVSKKERTGEGRMV